MHNQVFISQQLFDAIGAIRAEGHGVVLEGDVFEAGHQATRITINVGHPKEIGYVEKLVLRHTLKAGHSAFVGLSYGFGALCAGEHRSVKPFLEAISMNLDKWLRESVHEGV